MIERRIPKGYTHEVGALGRENEGSKPHALGVLAVAISQGSEPWYSVPRQEIEISWEAIEHLSKRERERESARASNAMQHPGGPVPYLTGRWPRAGLCDPAVLTLPLSGSKPGEAGSSQQAQGKMAALVVK